jgi:hypothetical protein
VTVQLRKAGASIIITLMESVGVIKNNTITILEKQTRKNYLAAPVLSPGSWNDLAPVKYA